MVWDLINKKINNKIFSFFLFLLYHFSFFIDVDFVFLITYIKSNDLFALFLVKVFVPE